MRGRLLGVSFLVLLVPAVAWTQGINTNVALPVAKGEGIWRAEPPGLRESSKGISWFSKCCAGPLPPGGGLLPLTMLRLGL